MNISEKLKKSILERLALTKKLATETSIVLHDEVFIINSQELQEKNVKELSKKIKSFFKNSEVGVIYTIELVDCIKYQRVLSNFISAKDKKKDGRSYSKVNVGNTSCKFLYVGSSKGKNLVTRIRNHFGLGGKTVYSMHLLYSFPKNVDCNIKISLYKANLPLQENNAINLLELYEQALWDECKPMFGKQSGLL